MKVFLKKEMSLQLDFEEMEKRFQEIEAEKQRKEEERMAAMQVCVAT